MTKLITKRRVMNNNVIGRNIKRHRMNLGIGVTQLAELCGIDRASLHRVESGDGLRVQTLINIACALRCPVGDLLKGCAMFDNAKSMRYI